MRTAERRCAFSITNGPAARLKNCRIATTFVLQTDDGQLLAKRVCLILLLHLSWTLGERRTQLVLSGDNMVRYFNQDEFFITQYKLLFQLLTNCCFRVGFELIFTDFIVKK